MVEQHPFKLLVPGSNPGRPTIRNESKIGSSDHSLRALFLAGSGNQESWDPALCAFANFDHNGDLNEMVIHPPTAVEASGVGILDKKLDLNSLL